MTSSDEDPTRDAECLRYQRMAPELALGVLCGRERAEMLIHLQQCGHCQDRVAALAVTAERLVELVPEVEPSVGFEQRVVAAIAAMAAPVSEPATAWSSSEESAEPSFEGRLAWRRPPKTNRSVQATCGPSPPARARAWAESARAPERQRRLAAATMLTGVCAALITGGIVASAGPVPAPLPAVTGPALQTTADVLSAPLISDSESHADGTIYPDTVALAGRPGREIGMAWIHPQSPSWVYITITDTAPAHEGPAPGITHDLQSESDTDETVTCTLVPRTGGTISLGTFTLRNGRADWATSINIDAHTLAQAQLTIAHGHTVARAAFPVTPTSTQPGKDPIRDSSGNKNADHSDIGFENRKKDDTRNNASRDASAGQSRSRSDVSAGGDQNGGVHTAAGIGSQNSKRRHTTDQTNGKDRRGHPGDVRDAVTSAVGDHSPPGDHRGHSRHDGSQQPHTKAGGDHQAGDRGVSPQPSASSNHGPGKVSTVH